MAVGFWNGSRFIVLTWRYWFASGVFITHISADHSTFSHSNRHTNSSHHRHCTSIRPEETWISSLFSDSEMWDRVVCVATKKSETESGQWLHRLHNKWSSLSRKWQKRNDFYCSLRAADRCGVNVAGSGTYFTQFFENSCYTFLPCQFNLVQLVIRCPLVSSYV